MAVFVTDGDQRSTLAVVRSLGRADVEVIVGESGWASLAGSSRYCSRSLQYPSPSSSPQAFMAFLKAELENGGYDLLVPMTDITMQLVALARDTLPSSVRIPFPGIKETSLVQDKGRLLDLAAKLGIPYPLTFDLREGEKLEDFASRLEYPVVVKPRCSRLLRDGRWHYGSIEYATDASGFIRAYRRIHDAIPYPVIQERLEGEGMGVFLLIWDGEIKAAFCHRRLREKPPWGGVSVLSESIPPDENLINQSLTLLKAVGWQGVAMVEFKMDRRDRIPKLMEVNGRFWGSLQLAIDSGVDFPLLLYRSAMGEPVPKQEAYRAGTKSRWLLGDLDHLLIRLTHPRSPNGAVLSPASRWAVLWNFLKFWDTNTRSEVFRLRDPRPAWQELRSYFKENWHRFRSRSDRGQVPSGKG